MRTRTVGWVWAVLAMGLGVVPLVGQERPVPTPLVERDEVRFITLDVVIEKRARRGWRPAVELERSQITLRVGGEFVELELFERHCRPEDGAGPLSPGDAATIPVAPEDDSPAEPVETSSRDPEEPSVSDPGPVRYILYFDLIHLKLGGFHGSFKAAERWIENTMQPGDEVMIVTGADALRIVRPLSKADDRVLDDLALAREDYMRTDLWAEWEGDGNRGRIREIMDQPTAAPPSYPGEPPEKAIAVAYASMDYNRTRRSLRNLTHLMTLFEEIEGTKNLVLFQQTLRLHPGDRYPNAGPLSDVVPLLDQLAESANERNVRIYPVDAAGLRIRGGIDNAMTLLATETGGRWLEGTNDLSLAFDRVAADASCFFRLGFRVRPLFSGHTEVIRVEVEGDSRYRTRHRRTLHDPTREEREGDRLRAAFLQPSKSTALPVSLITTSLLFESGVERVRLQMSVPLASLLALPAGGPGEEHRQVQVQFGATVIRLRPAAERGAGGTAGTAWADAAPESPSWSFSRQGILRLPFQSEGVDGRDVLLAEEILVPPGDYRVVAVAQDRLAAVLGAAVVDFTARADPPMLTEIFLLEETPEAVILERPTDEEAPEAEPQGEKRRARRKTIRPALPVLSPEVAMVPQGVVQAGRTTHLSYGVCAPAPETGFEGWHLARMLHCEGWDEPQDLPERVLSPPVPGSRCVLLADSLPPRMTPGSCTFVIRLSREGADDETRSLAFRVASAD